MSDLRLTQNADRTLSFLSKEDTDLKSEESSLVNKIQYLSNGLCSTYASNTQEIQSAMLELYEVKMQKESMQSSYLRASNPNDARAFQCRARDILKNVGVDPEHTSNTFAKIISDINSQLYLVINSPAFSRPSVMPVFNGIPTIDKQFGEVDSEKMRCFSQGLVGGAMPGDSNKVMELLNELESELNNKVMEKDYVLDFLNEIHAEINSINVGDEGFVNIKSKFDVVRKDITSRFNDSFIEQLMGKIHESIISIGEVGEVGERRKELISESISYLEGMRAGSIKYNKYNSILKSVGIEAARKKGSHISLRSSFNKNVAITKSVHNAKQPIKYYEKSQLLDALKIIKESFNDGGLLEQKQIMTNWSSLDQWVRKEILPINCNWFKNVDIYEVKNSIEKIKPSTNYEAALVALCEKNNGEVLKLVSNTNTNNNIVNRALCFQYAIGTQENLEMAFKLYKDAVDAKFAPAMYQLALCYQHGLGVEVSDKNNEEIFYLYQKAAEAGEVPAMFQLARCYQNGIGVDISDENNKTIFYLYEKATDANFAPAMYQLARCYQNGVGVDISDENNKKIFDLYKNAADAKFTPAMYQLAVCYLYGIGVNKSNDNNLLVFMLFQEASDAGFSSAKYPLALCYQNGIGVKKSDENNLKIFSLYSEGADAGFAPAMYKLAQCYQNGIGVEKSGNNNKTIFDLYKKAAAADFAPAMYQLAQCYQNGVGVYKLAENNEIIFGLYKKAADAGWAPAMYQLALCYQYGIGVAKSDDNNKIIFTLFEKAAKTGFSQAMYQLAQCYQNGIGVEVSDKNNKKIFYLYQKAADAGVAPAMYQLALCYQHEIGVSTSDNNKTTFDLYQKEVFDLYQKAVNAGFAPAMRQLAVCYKNGIGVDISENNNELIFSLLQKAANAGDAPAKYHLALCYQLGVGVNKSDDNNLKIFELYKEAAEAGNTKAMGELSRCYLNGIGTEKSSKQAFSWELKKALNEHDYNKLLYIGRAYLVGDVNLTDKDDAMAFKLFEMAAVTNMDAKLDLAFCYQRAIGTKKNERKAFELYREVAASDNNSAVSLALYKLGLCYSGGIGVKQSDGYAYEYLTKARANGNINAITSLAFLYQSGLGTHKNIKIAEELYKEASDKGDVIGTYELAFCKLSDSKNKYGKQEAFDLFTNAAERGHGESIGQLASCYRYGNGVSESYQKAEFLDHLYKAHQGDKDSMFIVGKLYISDKNKNGLLWLKKAAENGNSFASMLLDLARRQEGIYTKSDLFPSKFNL